MTLFAAAIICIAGLIFFLPRAATVVQCVGDGADFALAAVNGSLAHPPGFPVYTQVIQWLYAAFPVTNPYHLISLFSAICQSLAAAILVVVSCRLGSPWLISLGCGVGWLLFEGTCRTATDAEVFAFHHLMSIITAGLAVYLLNGNRRYLIPVFLLGLIWGLAGACHPVVIFWAPLVGGSAVLAGSQSQGAAGIIKALLTLTFAAALGVSSYLLLFFQSAETPLLAFYPIENFERLIGYALREYYGTFQMSSKIHVEGCLASFLKYTVKAAPIILLSFVPCLFLCLKDRFRHSLILLFFLTFISHILFVSMMYLPQGSDGISLRFFPSPLLGGFLMTAAISPKLIHKRRHLLSAASIIMAPALIFAPVSLESSDARNDLRGETYLKEAFREIPPNAIWLVDSDLASFGAVYRQQVFGERPDIDIIVQGRLGIEAYRNQLIQRLKTFREEEAEALKSKAYIAHAVMEAGRPVVAEPIAVPKGFSAIPLGVVLQWYPSDHLPGPDKVVANLMAHCMRWPSSVEDLSNQRHKKGWIWNGGYEKPLIGVMERVARQTGNQTLKQASGLLKAGNRERARQLCRQYYLGQDLKRSFSSVNDGE